MPHAHTVRGNPFSRNLTVYHHHSARIDLNIQTVICLFSHRELCPHLMGCSINARLKSRRPAALRSLPVLPGPDQNASMFAEDI